VRSHLLRQGIVRQGGSHGWHRLLYKTLTARRAGAYDASPDSTLRRHWRRCDGRQVSVPSSLYLARKPALRGRSRLGFLRQTRGGGWRRKW
jgi:hypothetical protein